MKKSLGGEQDAAMNYDYYVIKFFGKENVYLNFPEVDYTTFVPAKQIKKPQL